MADVADETRFVDDQPAVDELSVRVTGSNSASYGEVV